MFNQYYNLYSRWKRRVDVCLLQVTQTEMFGYKKKKNETFDLYWTEMTQLNDWVEKWWEDNAAW